MERTTESAEPGFEGFLDIFGDSGFAAEHVAESETEPEESPAPRRMRDAAETSAAEEESEEDDLTADERVAANFAAVADELGLTEEAGEEEEEDQLLGKQDGEVDYSDLSKLTREQLEALASESMGLKEKVQRVDEEEVMRRVQAAEQKAVQDVQTRFESEVREPSKKHYRTQFVNRLAAIIRDAATSENHDQHILRNAGALFDHLVESRLKYEEEEAQKWENEVEQAVLTARKNVPELREVYARQLLAANNLPVTDKSVAAVMKTKSGRERPADDFKDRVDELVEMRDRFARQQAKSTERIREEGKKRLRETSPRTTTAVRAKTRKPVEYKGEIEEGIKILSSIRGG